MGTSTRLARGDLEIVCLDACCFIHVLESDKGLTTRTLRAYGLALLLRVVGFQEFALDMIRLYMLLKMTFLLSEVNCSGASKLV